MSSIQVFSIMLLVLVIPITCMTESMVAGENILFYVFGSENCPHCRPMYEWLVETYGGDKVFFCELGIDECRNSFMNLVALGIQPYIPSTIIVNGTVRAILIGKYKDKKFIDELLNLPVSEKIPVYIGPELTGYIDGSARDLIMKDILVGIHSSTTTTMQAIVDTSNKSYLQYIAYTVSLAAIDSVNPCVFFLLFALLITVFMMGGQRLAVYSGIVFTVSVFISYMGLGLGLYKVTYFIPKWAMPILAVVFGILILIDVLGKIIVARILGRSLPECPLCKLYSDVLEPKIEKASSPIIWAGILGLLSSFTLLPCTAGPYILFARLIAELSLYEAILYLLLYNTVFVLPLLAITIIGSYLTRVNRIAEIMSRYEKLIRIIGSVLVIILGIYMFMGL